MDCKAIMHILFLSDNFPPEGNAPATRTFEHTREWVKLGHKVTVITCVPNFPEGKVFEGFKNKLYQKQYMDGVEVRRVKTYITANEGFFKRILDYLSFMFSSVLAGLFVRKPDVVIATSPQFFCACGGWFLALIKRKPFIFELRDIWPASIRAVGVTNNSLVISALEKLELFIYRQAALIISVTNSFKNELVGRGIEKNKIVIVFNGVDLSKYSPEAKNVDLKLSLGLDNKFVIGYVGTIGLAHSVETIVSAGELLKDNKDVAFLVAGGGAETEKIASLLSAKKIDNFWFLGMQDKSKVPALLSLCDVSVVHLRNSELFGKVIPSKIFESFAMGLPVIIGVPEGEATALVRENSAGIVIEPENPLQMVNAVLELQQDQVRCNQLKLNCLSISKRYDRKQLAQDLLREIEQVVCSR